MQNQSNNYSQFQVTESILVTSSSPNVNNIKKNLKIFNASAGSGKTYTLVKEYLRIILPESHDHMKFRKILAMTFTNKAANEMKERIIQKLIQLSKPRDKRSDADNKEISAFVQDLGLKEQELCDNAEKCLNTILHHYGQFSVMTIDKFTHKVIRTFAKELNLSIDFEVELDLDTLRKNVADMLFDRIGRDSEITRLMLRYAKSNLEEDRTWKFRESLVEFSKQLYREDAIDAIKQLTSLDAEDFLEIQHKLIAERSRFENSLRTAAKEALDTIEAQQLEIGDFAYGKSGGAMAYFIKIASGKKFERASDRLINSIAEGRWASGSTKKTAQIDAIANHLKACFERINRLFENEYPRYLLHVELLKLINNLSLLKHLLQITDEIKTQDNVLLISDFYKTISNVISKEPVPFIYERLGVRYEHFLLDEFQDTSHLQWVNLVPLLHNSVAMNKENLIVGDGKQAIYRWRNGEVEQFVKLPDEVYNPGGIVSLSEAQTSFRRQGELLNLSTNFRSAPEIVNFNNAFFEFLLVDKNDFAKKIYKKSAQVPQKTHKGYLEFKIFPDKEDLLQLNYVTETVQRSLTKGYQLTDICVLVNKNKTGSAIARHLTSQGIKVISQDSLYVSKDLKVRFIFNLICSLSNTLNINYAKKCIEHFDLIFGQSQHLFDFINAQKIDINAWFKQQGFELKSHESFHSFYEYVEHLIAIFDLDLSSNVYLQFFLEQVHLFEKRHSSDVHTFIDWFNEKGHEESIQSPEGADAVKIMTIHKAKGLQFPVVIGAFFDWDIKKNRSKKWIAGTNELLPAFPLSVSNNTRASAYGEAIIEEDRKFELDQLNVLYVALTRPETVLFVCGSTHSDRSGSLMKNWIVPFLEKDHTFNQIDSGYVTGSFENAVHQQKEISGLHMKFCKQVMDKPALSTKNSDQWDIHDLDKKREFGTHLHLLLSKIEKADQVNSNLNALVRKGLIPEDMKERLLENARQLFQDKHFSSYFEQNAMNETSIIDTDGKAHVPDKIIRDKDRVLVVDFKTGEELLSQHQKQVRKYMDLLLDLGYDNVCGELFYTESLKAIAVEFE